MHIFAKYCPKPLVGLTEKKNSIFSKGHVTGVAFSSTEILASYSGDSVYLFDINTSKQFVKEISKQCESDTQSQGQDRVESPRLASLENLMGDRDIYGENEEEEHERKEIKEEKIEQEMDVEKQEGESFACQYTGHCNMRTVKSVSFFGPHQEYVMSGSDDGNIFIWEKKNGTLVNLIKGDKHVVNVLCGHPFDPILATVGIDKSVKIFSPISPHMNSLENAATTMLDNLDRLESGPVRPMAIPMALLRRLFQSVHEGGAFAIDSSDDEAEVEGFLDAEVNPSDDDSDDNDDWSEGSARDRPDGCPMQ
jgi:WD40 repeat protein